MEIVLLTHPLDGDTPSYANRDRVEIARKEAIELGNTANTSTVHFSNNHIGTHVDLPRHFFDTGRTVTDIEPADWFFTRVCLIEIPCDSAKLISIEDLKIARIRTDADFLIIRTGFESKRGDDAYWNSYPGIAAEACRHLRQNFRSLRAIGFDFISLTSPLFKSEGKAAHEVLLDDSSGAFVFVVEDMKLKELKKEPATLCMAPLMISNANGTPVTLFGIY